MVRLLCDATAGRACLVAFFWAGGVLGIYGIYCYLIGSMERQPRGDIAACGWARFLCLRHLGDWGVYYGDECALETELADSPGQP